MATFSKAKWKTQIEDRFKNLSNRALLNACLEAFEPDDYFGCFTRKGQYGYYMAILELNSRLGPLGFPMDESAVIAAVRYIRRKK